MCGVTNCPLAWREVLALRQIVDELSEGCAENSLSLKLDAGRLLCDVATALGLDQWSVLNPAIMARLLDEDNARLWPTFSEAEEAEIVDLANVRQDEIPLPIWPEHLAAWDHVYLKD